MALKILSVDDEQDLELLLTQYFRRKIRRGEYEFFFAHNGLEGLDMLLQHPDISVILCDINMPEMDGFAMLAKVNEMRNPALKCIMVSAYGDMGNIRHAMNNGAFDFATKPIDLEDLEKTIEKAAEEIHFVQTTQKEHHELDGLHNELSDASRIQHAILPSEFPPFPEIADKIDIHASMEAAKNVGGDFYDFFRIGEDRIGFNIADVSGKGVPAAIFMAVSRTLLRTTGLQGYQSQKAIELVNDILARESIDSMFVTCFYGILNLQTGSLDFTNAGHNVPYILRANGQLEPLTGHTNIVLGAFEGFDYLNDHATLNPGDTLVAYTDGVTEAETLSHEQYGEKRLEALLSSGLTGKDCHEITQAIIQSVADFTGGADQSDDLTLLALKRK